MSILASSPSAGLVDADAIETRDVVGAMIQFLTLPDEGESAPCIMRGMIPAGGFVPLHSHPDPETFLSISGYLDGLTQPTGGFTWVRIRPGDVFHVPGGAKHAFRNPSSEPAIAIVVSTARLGRFFQEAGTPVVPGSGPRPPSAETVRHFLETVARYGYWNAGAEENSRIGISLQPA